MYHHPITHSEVASRNRCWLKMEGNPGLLPADVLLEIFSYCSYRDLVQFQFVCRSWQEVSRYKNLWRDIVYKPVKREKTKGIIENLKASPELRALDLRNVRCRKVTKELVIEIVNACPQLEQLSVCWYCLYKKFHFKMEKIKILFLNNNKDGFELKDYFEHLHNCFPNVEHLDFTKVTSGASNFYAYLRKKGPSFHTLGFSCIDYCGSPDECRLSYLSLCPNLQSLTVSYVCDDVAFLPCVESVERLKEISSLTFRKSNWYHICTHLCLFTILPNLVELVLDRCVLHNDELLLFIAKKCPSLEKLTLSSEGFSDDSLKYVSNFKKLTYLCLKSSSEITDACVVYLQAILELRYLIISDCCKITPQCLLVLCGFAQLQILKFDLQNCDPAADLGVSHVKNPDLHIMFYNCKDMSVLEYLRIQQLRISSFKGPYLSHE